MPFDANSCLSMLIICTITSYAKSLIEHDECGNECRFNKMCFRVNEFKVGVNNIFSGNEQQKLY